MHATYCHRLRRWWNSASTTRNCRVWRPLGFFDFHSVYNSSSRIELPNLASKIGSGVAMRIILVLAILCTNPAFSLSLKEAEESAAANDPKIRSFQDSQNALDAKKRG